MQYQNFDGQNRPHIWQDLIEMSEKHLKSGDKYFLATANVSRALVYVSAFRAKTKAHEIFTSSRVSLCFREKTQAVASLFSCRAWTDIQLVQQLPLTF